MYKRHANIKYFFKIDTKNNRAIPLRVTEKYFQVVTEPEGPELFQYGMKLCKLQPLPDHILLEIAKINGYLTGDFKEYRKLLKERVLMEVEYEWERSRE